MSEARRAIVFRGRVQGVGFRWTTAKVAERFAVCGWVRNESDGSVRCEIEGDEREIEAFLAAIEEAMPGHVSDREDVPMSTSNLSRRGFEIRH